MGRGYSEHCINCALFSHLTARRLHPSQPPFLRHLILNLHGPLILKSLSFTKDAVVAISGGAGISCSVWRARQRFAPRSPVGETADCTPPVYGRSYPGLDTRSPREARCCSCWTGRRRTPRRGCLLVGQLCARLSAGESMTTRRTANKSMCGAAAARRRPARSEAPPNQITGPAATRRQRGRRADGAAIMGNWYRRRMMIATFIGLLLNGQTAPDRNGANIAAITWMFQCLTKENGGDTRALPGSVHTNALDFDFVETLKRL